MTMKTINKNRLRTITLLIGILTALLLIFGNFTFSAESGVNVGLFSWVFDSTPISEVINFSSAVIKSIATITP